MKLLGISGSLRKESTNTKLLKVAAGCLPEGVTMRIISCGEIPLYNGDLDGDVKPESVVQLIAAIGESDGVLIATPEYNYSIPGVLKNAIDWASRPAYKSVLAKKPAAILSAAKSVVGGARVQSHLRDIFSSTLTPIVPSPPYLLPQSNTKFDAEGKLVEEGDMLILERYVKDFVEWVELLK